MEPPIRPIAHARCWRQDANHPWVAWDDNHRNTCDLRRANTGAAWQLVVASAAAAVLIIALVACAPKPDPILTPGTVKAWQANEAIIALGTVQRAAVNLHAIHRCDDNGENCVRLLSEDNTRAVVTAILPALEEIKATPPSWRFVATKALDQADKGMDPKGHEKMDPYLKTARSIINGL